MIPLINNNFLYIHNIKGQERIINTKAITTILYDELTNRYVIKTAEYTIAITEDTFKNLKYLLFPQGGF